MTPSPIDNLSAQNQEHPQLSNLNLVSPFDYGQPEKWVTLDELLLPEAQADQEEQAKRKAKKEDTKSRQETLPYDEDRLLRAVRKAWADGSGSLCPPPFPEAEARSSQSKKKMP